ncbi:MAG: hypothetical protein JNM79_16510 [Burkholderiales bacterium]|nr:hypothetical protein [Burkholderiales bacterium]
MSILLDLFRLAWAIYWFVGAALLAWVVWRAPKPWQKATGAALVLFVFRFFPVKWGIEDKARREALIARNNAVKAHFEKRCKEDARITIHRVVENVDGVFIMKPRTRATEVQLQDQYWMGDPYGYVRLEGGRPQSLLYDATHDKNGEPRKTVLPGYRYVEAPSPESSNANPTYPYVRWEGREPTHRSYNREEAIPIKALSSRYGIDWDDISTKEDRKYWIAGGRTRVIDLHTKEVIAERIGYWLDREQGGRVGGMSWSNYGNVACPAFVNTRDKTLEFLSQVLLSSKGLGYGK